MRKHLNQWKCTVCSQAGRLDVIKKSALSNLIHRFNPIPIHVVASDFIDTNKLILKFTCKCKGHKISNTIPRKQNKIGSLNYLLRYSI